MEIDKTKVLEAGKIASQVKTYARTIVKKDVPLLEIAEKIEARISELGGKPAFPLNLSINETAAHYPPSHDDKALASGLLKVDFGVHIDGWTADNAFSLDLENSEENKRLIETAEEALNKALDIVKLDIAANQIGGVISETIESRGFSPIINLCGHSIKKEYDKLPFCSRWIVEALDSKALFGLRELEANGNLHHFNQLVEVSGAKVSQAEQRILIEENKVTVTTL